MNMRINLRFAAFHLAGAGLLASFALAQSAANRPVGEHWVTTWAAAQPLTAPVARPGGGALPRPPASSSNAAGSNIPNPQQPPRQTGRGPAPRGSNLPTTFSDQTIRMVLRISLGGRSVRIEVSNMMGAQPLEIGAAHVAVYKGSGAIVPGTDRRLTFSGAANVTIAPGVLALSDPVSLDVAPLSDLAVSLYLPHDTGPPANHTVGLHTSYISAGDVTASDTMPDSTKTTAYAWLSGVDVLAPADAFAIVAFGDSITDGYATTIDGDHAWPTLLARRLNQNKPTQHVAVVNLGISGNQVLRDGAGSGALARFDRDVLSRPGVQWVILLEGINDINIRGRLDGTSTPLTPEELIAGYRQFIERCHLHGIKVVGATIMPEEGVPTATEHGNEVREAVNRWIRAPGNFDAVVDFDAVVRDPQRPVKLRAELDPGDHIHPNDQGNQAMADAFDLGLFKK